MPGTVVLGECLPCLLYQYSSPRSSLGSSKEEVVGVFPGGVCYFPSSFQKQEKQCRTLSTIFFLSKSHIGPVTPYMQPVDGKLVPLPFEHLTKHVVLIWQRSQEKYTNDLVFNIRTICTHVADIFNHCRKNWDGVGTWFDAP